MGCATVLVDPELEIAVNMLGVTRSCHRRQYVRSVDDLRSPGLSFDATFTRPSMPSPTFHNLAKVAAKLFQSGPLRDRLIHGSTKICQQIGFHCACHHESTIVLSLGYIIPS